MTIVCSLFVAFLTLSGTLGQDGEVPAGGDAAAGAPAAGGNGTDVKFVISARFGLFVRKAFNFETNLFPIFF